MKGKNLFKKLRYRLQYLPFTRNTLIAVIVTYSGIRLLQAPSVKEQPENATLPFIRIMSAYAGWVLLAFVGLSLISTLGSWLYFLWLYRNGRSKLEITVSGDTRKKGTFLNARLPKAWKPLLGYIKGRLYYDDLQLTDKFSMQSSERKKNSLLRAAVTGKNRLQLPDIKEYQLKGGILFFEDILQLISLPVAQPLSGSFYQAPTQLELPEENINPKKTDTLDVRIDELRKVEGEYLNYKDYESGDDVRRIVWKLFARNRSLVVRVPERMEPYASHIYFYASFYKDLTTSGNEAYAAEMLNYYKSQVWSVYNELSKKEWQVKYIPDQELRTGGSTDSRAQVERLVSNSDWHKDLSLRAYFSTKKGSVLLVHSFSDPKEIEQIIEEADPSLRIMFVPLSQCFRNLYVFRWISRLLFLPGTDRLAKLKANWVLTPLRRRVLKNEKTIAQILKQHHS
ncbi:DUF58 domain-containing protein [Rurimicrobium arvi]|uniref:DUF58 domain-containing protein n=1 Tax=Rurimicrobium arvi TaxID=2049916 RepID=A0ABP8MUA0_9BACT